MKRQELINLLESLRIDVITEDAPEFNQDEIGAMLSILGVEEYKEIYGHSIIKDNALTSEQLEKIKIKCIDDKELLEAIDNILKSY